MSIPSVEILLESGVHFGHQTSRWNPKMKPYIFGRKNLIHIIDLRYTLRGVIRGANLLKNVAALGEFILYVGTKRQARSVILAEAQRTGMPYVTERWLGGTLTNFMTIRSRLNRLNELEEIERSGMLQFYTKKEIARFRRELHKLHRNLTGIRDMDRLPGALVVVDPGKEDIAVKEAKKLEIPVIGLVDTDTNPELVDIVVPCNDDAFRSIKIILSRLADAVLEGRKLWEDKRDIDQKAAIEARARARPAPAPKKRRPRKRAGEPRRGASAPRAGAARKPQTSKDKTQAAGTKEKKEPAPVEKPETEETAQQAQAETETS